MDGGSSPLSRGIPGAAAFRVEGLRIIPALAGNTRRFARGCCQNRDHPRSRGEYKMSVRMAVSGAGSSPLSRGIRFRRFRAGGGGRIIPALAGNTLQEMLDGPPRPDHPRSRGEYASTRSVSRTGEGSSPLSRGIRRRPGQHPTRVRIIPALAGNTSDRSSNPGTSPDHPRSRGEYSPVKWR